VTWRCTRSNTETSKYLTEEKRYWFLQCI